MALVSVDEHGRPDDHWRVEPRDAGLYDLRWRRALVLEKASMDQVARYLLEHGADVERLEER